MINNMNQKIINFIQDFGCSTTKQLQILFDDKNNNFKNILSSNMVSKKNDIFIHNNKAIDVKMLAALDVLCKYKNRYTHFHRNFEPVYITFLAKDNTLYHIIVTDKNNEKGIVKLLKNSAPTLFNADKFILLFEDTEMLEYIECSKPYIYCTYPEIKIINN